MGLENRDYLRDESRRYGSGGYSGGPSVGVEYPICRYILIVTIAVFILQIFSVRNWTPQELQDHKSRIISEFQKTQARFGPDDLSDDALRRIENLPLNPVALGLPSQTSVVQNWLQLATYIVLSGQIWRLLTCALCHDRQQLSHILFNMLFLWWFGRTLESMYGSREFLWFYIGGALAASLAYVAIDLVSGDWVPMIGASGAVMAVTMLFAIHFPYQKIYIFFVLPVEIRWVVLFYVVYDLHPVLLQLSGDPAASGVAHAAHLGGLAFGYAYARRQFRLDPTMSRLQQWWNDRRLAWKGKRRGFRVVGVTPSVNPSRREKLTQEMDVLLQKISDHGEASLTNAERKALERVSRELRELRG